MTRTALLSLSLGLLAACGGDPASTANGTASTPATDAAVPYREGEHYERVDPPLDAPANEVVEVFSYACPACAQFQPEIDEWKRGRGDAVTLRYVPAEFSPAWEPFARAFHTAQEMGALGRLHRAIFDGLYRQGRRPTNIQEISELVAVVGMDPARFLVTSQLAQVNDALERSREYVRATGVASTPTLVVGGRYRVQREQPGAISPLLVVDWLIENTP